MILLDTSEVSRVYNFDKNVFSSTSYMSTSVLVLSEFSLSPDPVFSALKSMFDVTLVVSRAF